MKLGVIADDFTGASDIASTLAEGGMRATQYVGVPSAPADDVDAGVVALKTRTAPVSQAIALSLQASDWLLAQGCEQLIYKVCSTFDSTDRGNIGPVLAALGERLGEQRIVVCPAFPENGRSVYQGHLFVDDRLLSECGMQNHPLTPMRDPDLRRVLSRQTDWDVGHIPISTVAAGSSAIAQAMTGDREMLIVDAISNEDLKQLGKAVSDRKLLCGGSGIALGLPGNFGHDRRNILWSGIEGKAVILSGSCSATTRLQVEHYRSIAPSIELVPRSIVNGSQTVGGIADWAMGQTDKAPLIFSSADPGDVAAAQLEFGRERLAAAIEAFFSDLATEFSARGVTRIVSAGGETSGAVVAGLHADVLHIGPRIAPGVPALRVGGRDMVIALKSGNFGDMNFFQKALDILADNS